MADLTITTLTGSIRTIPETAVSELENAVTGEVLREGDESYDEARTLWNAMIDRHPALIVRCRRVDDIAHAVNFARAHNVLLSVKGGGHNIAGNAVCDGGLTIDLSQMKGVRVEPDKRLAHVEPGATLGDVDRATQAHGLATPLGINSTTGAAGLTLGGGFGWLSRKYGMTVDNLTAADVVTPDGKVIRANANENSDLFWALRGGGGNFGVVSRFEYRLYPVGPEVFAGLFVFPHSDAPNALREYRDYAAALGDETSVWAVLRKAPPLPFLPESVHGSDILVFAAFHAGDAASGEQALAPIRDLGTLLGEHLGPQPYTEWQTAFDPLLTPGARNYWKSHNFTELSDELLDVLVRYAGNLPSSQTEIFLGLLGGAVGRVDPDETAYPHRESDYIVNMHGRWDDASDDRRCITWAREFFDQMTPFATGGVYSNFMTEDETDRVGAAYGSNYERLAAVKRRYDPTNLFRLNHNISPNGK